MVAIQGSLITPLRNFRKCITSTTGECCFGIGSLPLPCFMIPPASASNAASRKGSNMRAIAIDENLWLFYEGTHAKYGHGLWPAPSVSTATVLRAGVDIEA